MRCQFVRNTRIGKLKIFVTYKKYKIKPPYNYIRDNISKTPGIAKTIRPYHNFLLGSCLGLVGKEFFSFKAKNSEKTN